LLLLPPLTIYRTITEGSHERALGSRRATEVNVMAFSLAAVVTAVATHGLVVNEEGGHPSALESTLRSISLGGSAPFPGSSRPIGSGQPGLGGVGRVGERLALPAAVEPGLGGVGGVRQKLAHLTDPWVGCRPGSGGQ
jgi:hypothetical protein